MTRGQGRWFSLVSFFVAAVTPVVLFGHVAVLLAAEPKPGVHYLMGWLPWALLLGGLLFLLPVAWSSGRDPDSRWFPRARGAYFGWGTSLYLLGFLVLWQVAEIQANAFG